MPDPYFAVRAEQASPSRRLDVRLDTSLELLLEGAPTGDDSAVLATVVATTGSTYRKPGARMLIMADGGYLGLLSGGCFESDLQAHALEVLNSGMPRAVEYDMRGPDDILFGIGAGCEGAMRVLLEPAGAGTPAAAALAAAGRATQNGEASSLVIVHEAAEFRLGTYHGPTALPVAASTRTFIQHLAPPPHLLICGAGPDVQPVASAARALRWRVTVVDHRPAFATAARFPGARVRRIDAQMLRSEVDLAQVHAAVVMSHHLASDQAYLRELAEAGAPAYVGLLGPEARRLRIAAELGPVAEKLRARIHGPVGMDIGAVTPEGIALSIVSQIHAWLAGRLG
jgi:xanthine dehydrogenase accessory factor